MLKQADNERVTRSGPGTPLGRLMRAYWQPAALVSEMPADRPVKAVRLLGEDLVLFRREGGWGLVGRFCAHRGVDLSFGRLEDGGLRCLYHGWLYGPDGRCLEQPAEPEHSTFASRVRIPSYPCEERNGVIWTYMGPRQTPPPLPQLEWNMVADNVPWMWRNYRNCNWMQALEGGIESSHVNFLHKTLDRSTTTVPGAQTPNPAGNEIQKYGQNDAAPRLEIVDTEYGAIYTGARRVDEVAGRLEPVLAFRPHRLHAILARS